MLPGFKIDVTGYQPDPGHFKTFGENAVGESAVLTTITMSPSLLPIHHQLYVKSTTIVFSSVIRQVTIARKV